MAAAGWHADGDWQVPADLTAGRALSSLSGIDGRFFLWLHFFDPHAPCASHRDFDFGTSAGDRYDSS